MTVSEVLHITVPPRCALKKDLGRKKKHVAKSILPPHSLEDENAVAEISIVEKPTMPASVKSSSAIVVPVDLVEQENQETAEHPSNPEIEDSTLFIKEIVENEGEKTTETLINAPPMIINGDVVPERKGSVPLEIATPVEIKVEEEDEEEKLLQYVDSKGVGIVISRHCEVKKDAEERGKDSVFSDEDITRVLTVLGWKGGSKSNTTEIAVMKEELMQRLNESEEARVAETTKAEMARTEMQAMKAELGELKENMLLVVNMLKKQQEVYEK
jgi:hypothetical protein